MRLEAQICYKAYCRRMWHGARASTAKTPFPGVPAPLVMYYGNTSFRSSLDYYFVHLPVGLLHFSSLAVSRWITVVNRNRAAPWLLPRGPFIRCIFVIVVLRGWISPKLITAGAHLLRNRGIGSNRSFWRLTEKAHVVGWQFKAMQVLS